MVINEIIIIVIANILSGVIVVLNIKTANSRVPSVICGINQLSIIVGLVVSLLLGTYAMIPFAVCNLVRASLAKRNKLKFKYLLMLLSISIPLSIYIQESLWGYLVIAGSSLSTLSYYYINKSEKAYRLLRIASAIPGATYYGLSRNYSSVFLELYGVYKALEILIKISKYKSLFKPKSCSDIK